MTKEEFLTRVDKNIFLPQEIRELWWGEYDWANEVDYIRGEDRRWSHFDEKILKIDNRFFAIGCDVGLTEYQEDEYCAEVYEVYPMDRQIIITEWKRKK